MGIYESDTIIFHGATEESMGKIRAFLQGYNDLFKMHFGEDNDDGNIYIGGIPTYGFEIDRESDSFPRSEGFYVAGISPRWAKGWYWENAIGFLGVFLEQKLCSKITWYRYWDQGETNCIYMNETQDGVPFSWKYYEFVPGENGVPPEYNEDDEDDEEFNQFVNGIMKGERDVKWRQGFPDYWHDQYDNLSERMRRERLNGEGDFDFGDGDEEGKNVPARTGARSVSRSAKWTQAQPAGEQHTASKTKGQQPGGPRTSAEGPDSSPSCMKCGRQNRSGAIFCMGCGAKLNGGDATANNEAGFPPSASNDFTLIGSFIHWNILPEQIAVKIDENDIAAYGSAVKGVSIQDGVKALFFYNGKLTAELGPGSHLFKDLGVEIKQKKEGDKDKKNNKKKLFVDFINRISSILPGIRTARANNDRARNAGLTNRIPASIPPVSIVLIRTTDFPLVFMFPDTNTAKLRCEIGLQTLCRVNPSSESITAFYSMLLSGDRKMISLKVIGETLEPVFRREVNMLFGTVAPDQVNYNPELQNRLLLRLQSSVPQVYAFVSITNIVSLTASNPELDILRRKREELYISEQTLEETMRRNIFLTRQQEEISRQFLRMRGIQDTHNLSVRRMDNAQSISLAQMDAAMAAAKEKIFEEMALTDDEKAKFNMLLVTQRRVREAKNGEELETELQVFAKNGLLRQQEMDNLRHLITQDAKVRDLSDVQILSLATMRNQQELDRKKLEWEMQAEKERLDHQIEQNRKRDGFQTEHFRTELEMERLKREQNIGLDYQVRQQQMELWKQMQALKQENADAELRRKIELEKTQAEHQREITRIYTVMTADQIMASNPDITPEAAQALAEKFKAEAAAAQSDKSAQYMEQLIKMQQDHAKEMIDAKQQELDRTISNLNADSDRFVDGIKTTLNTFSGTPQMNRFQAQQTSGDTPPGSPRPRIFECPRCHHPVEDDAFFCSHCGMRF